MRDSEQLWEWTAAERRGVADLLESLSFEQTNEASACRGWRVRDVAGHLVWAAENSPRQLVTGMARSGVFINRMIAAESVRVGLLPTPELVARLRATADRRPHLVAPVSYLADVIVHAQDMARPLGLTLEGPYGTAADLPVECLIRATRHYLGPHQLAFGGRPNKNVRLVAVDADFQFGDGPDVRCRLIDMLLIASGRSRLAVIDGEGAVMLQKGPR